MWMVALLVMSDSGFVVSHETLPNAFHVAHSDLPLHKLRGDSEQPLMEFYTARWCYPCIAAKEAIGKEKNLPFSVLQIDVDSLDDFDGQIPQFRWNCKKSKDFPNGRAVLTGWYGIEHLLNEYKRTNK